MFEGVDLSQLPAAIEALLFVSDEPVNAVDLAKVFDENVEEIEAALATLKTALDDDARGIQLREVAGGWRLYTHPAFHDLIQKYVLSWDTRRMSNAALETLAIVAYAQPVTRAQVSAIRGVTSDGPISTLVERGLVREAGYAETPGNPALYTTTQTFLEKYGLRSVADLPDLVEFAPDEKTAQLIRERLGVIEAVDGQEGFAEGRDDADVQDVPSVDQMAAVLQGEMSEVLGGALGVVDKIDFDKLTFNTDDE